MAPPFNLSACGAMIHHRPRRGRSTLAAFSHDGCFLNFVGVRGELVAEDAGQCLIVQDNQIGVVFFVIVVLPSLVPPAESDNGRPVLGEEFLQRSLRTLCTTPTVSV